MSRADLIHIASRILNRPLLLHPSKAEVLLHVLQGRLPIDGATLPPLSSDANRFIGRRTRPDGSTRFNRAVKGIAIITIEGSLVNRGAWIGANSGLVSYEGIAAQLRDAAGDDTIHTVLLDIDSPGGEATGMYATAKLVAEVAAEKRVVAFVNDMAASAAYGIASQADEIVVSPTSIVGSIGVVLTHLDRSGALEQQGVKPTLIYAGAHKVDGHPFGPLSDTVKADLQAEVAQFYDTFVNLVADGRGSRLSAEQARATEARTFLGAEAIRRGLADRAASLDDLLAELAATAPRFQTTRTAPAQTARPAVPARAASGLPPALAPSAAEQYRRRAAEVLASPEAGMKPRQAMRLALMVDAPVSAVRTILASLPRDSEANLPPGIPASPVPLSGEVQGERDRIVAIMASAEAEGREKLAATLALETSTAVAAALAIMRAAPRQARIPTIEERAAGQAEFGDGGVDTMPTSRTAGIDAVWRRAIDSANRPSAGGAEADLPTIPEDLL